MKTRWKILIVLGILLLLAAASAWMSAHIRPESEVEAYKKLLREKGEKLEISEVLPPPVPAESNSVSAVEDAFRLFGSGSEKFPDAMKMVAPGKAMVCWMQPNVFGYDFTNSWDDFAIDVEADHQAVELLHEVLNRPRLNFQLDYKKEFTVLVQQLMPMKRSTQKLEAAAILDIHNSGIDAALTNILTILGLVQRNEGDGLLISHLVRIAMTAIAVAPTWELLQTTNVMDTQLASLQQGWEQMNYLNDAKNTYAVERAWTSDTMQKYRASHEEFQKILGLGSPGGSSGASWSWPPDWEELTEKPRYAVGEVMWRNSWSFSEELRTLKKEQIILEALRMMQTNRSQFYKADYNTMIARMSPLGITNAGEAFFRALKIPDFSETFGAEYLYSVVAKTLRMETTRRVVVTAIALKRFKLKHDVWPETLDELVPKFLSSVPVDPNDGKPLRYHPNKDGTYLLYSVGENGVDDGGNPILPAGIISTSLHWQNAHAPDWVWPQPATDAEIKYFYEHPPK